MLESFRVPFGWAGPLLLVLALAAPVARGETVKFLELENEVVCRVNTMVISKRDVEVRMISSGQAMFNLFMFREKLKQDGEWNETNQSRFNEMYIPAFRDELRNAIKEKLMMQEAKREAIEVPKAKFEKRFNQMVEHYRQKGLINQPGFTFVEIKDKLNDQLILEEFRNRFINMLDLPKRPEIQKYYEDHIKNYQRGPGTKVRQVRVDKLKINSLGQTEVVKDALGRAQTLRDEIVKYGASFEEIARTHSDDDEEMRKRGGLILDEHGEEYVDLKKHFSRHFAQLSRLKNGEVSPVLDLNDRSLLIVSVEDRRDAGPKPLDEKLYQEIYDKLLDTTMRRKEDKWLREAVKQNLIVGIQDGKEAELPMHFFFPDDPVPAQQVSAETPSK